MTDDLASAGSPVAKMHCTFENCTEEVLNKCRACGLDYCLEHGSAVDPARYCVNCLIVQDAEVQVGPLIDEEGTQHQGRSIHPTGKGYRLAAKLIQDMTNDELKLFVEEEKLRVADIERIREYHHITLGMAESELYQRRLSPFSEHGGVLRVGTSTRTFPRQKARSYDAERTPSSRSKTSKVDKIATMLQGLGISAKDLAVLIAPKGGKK